MQPDWVYEPHLQELTLNTTPSPGTPGEGRGEGLLPPESPGITIPGSALSEVEGFPHPINSAPHKTPSRESLWRRPAIELEIIRVHSSAWQLFRPHHYLSGKLHPSSQCFLALASIDHEPPRPAAFVAALPFPHATRPGWREHRCVCLPEFQGIGIGNAFSEFVANLFTSIGKPYFSTTSHPAMIHHRARSPLWKLRRKPSFTTHHRGLGHECASAATRLTASFEFTGPPQLAS